MFENLTYPETVELAVRLRRAEHKAQCEADKLSVLSEETRDYLYGALIWDHTQGIADDLLPVNRELWDQWLARHRAAAR